MNDEKMKTILDRVEKMSLEDLQVLNQVLDILELHQTNQEASKESAQEDV